MRLRSWLVVRALVSAFRADLVWSSRVECLLQAPFVIGEGSLSLGDEVAEMSLVLVRCVVGPNFQIRELALRISDCLAQCG